MKLYATMTSPYARKVRAIGVETGLRDRIEYVEANPWAPDSPLGALNPLGKVPALVTDDGDVLFDSPVICEYLDGLHSEPPFFPEEPAERTVALRWQALGDGLMDAMVAHRLEGLRAPELRSADWAARQRKTIRTALDFAEARVGDLDGVRHIGHIAMACALAFLDFRLPEEAWRGAHPGLEAWYARFCENPCIKETRPPAA